LTNVDVRYDDLVDLVGKRLSIEEFVDRITFMGAGPEGVQGDVMTFDIFPNRPDLYSAEGIARGLRGFLGLELGLPTYHVDPPQIDFIVDPSVADVRPYAVGGIAEPRKVGDAFVPYLFACAAFGREPVDDAVTCLLCRPAEVGYWEMVSRAPAPARRQ